MGEMTVARTKTLAPERGEEMKGIESEALTVSMTGVGVGGESTVGDVRCPQHFLPLLTGSLGLRSFSCPLNPSS